MKVLRLGQEDYNSIINAVVYVLEHGGMVVYPSDTVYGLGVDAANDNAVKKIFEFKGRRFGKAVSVAVDSMEMAERYVELNETAKNFYGNFLPGPYTIISKFKIPIRLQTVRRPPYDLKPYCYLSSLLFSENGGLGIRIPDSKLIIDLVKKLRRPITATSANLSGTGPHYSVQSLLNTLSEKKKAMIDLVIDGGRLPRVAPSTVVDTTLDSVNVVRDGSGKWEVRNEIKKREAGRWITKSEQETRNFAKKLFKQYYDPRECLIFALEGELGAGKTVFAQGIAQAMGIGPVNSPTYTIIKEYGYLIHIDTYRLRDAQELLDLGFEKYIKPGNVLVIEWAGKIMKILEAKKANIVFVEIVDNGSYREIKTQNSKIKT